MSSAKKMISLKSSDGATFVVEDTIAILSPTIKHMIELNNCPDNSITLPNVTSKVLAKVIDYCKFHLNAAASKDKLSEYEFDAEFVKVDQTTLFDLILAAHYLNISNLLNLTCQTVANMMKAKTPDELRRIFNIRDDKEEENLVLNRIKNLYLSD